jgi:hypothetical protein
MELSKLAPIAGRVGLHRDAHSGAAACCPARQAVGGSPKLPYQMGFRCTNSRVTQLRRNDRTFHTRRRYFRPTIQGIVGATAAGHGIIGWMGRYRSDVG